MAMVSQGCGFQQLVGHHATKDIICQPSSNHDQPVQNTDHCMLRISLALGCKTLTAVCSGLALLWIVEY